MFNKLFMSFIVFFIADRIPYRRKGKQGHSFLIMLQIYGREQIINILQL
jgi:hypothetical protein